MFDQLGSEGYQYAAAGGGYQSNVINWNSADALIYNSEFAPGGKFKTLSNGYSSIFRALFHNIHTECEKNGIHLDYHAHTRLRSIWLDPDHDDTITFTLAAAKAPYVRTKEATTKYAFLAMPPASLEIVAEATRYDDRCIVDVLNAEKVALYREAVIKQPSYKVAMFFDTDWWTRAIYPPKLDDSPINKGEKNVYGPTITDTPLRQIYYFGNNGLDENTPVYAMLCSYDDERFVKFWRELELTVEESRTIPLSQDTQPLIGPKPATPAMINVLRAQLARVHFGSGADASRVPEPLETVFMDWSLKPFSAGYHAWAPHYDINDVMQTIRKPTQLMKGAEANLFIVGSAYSNDQAWVEGAFCTSESVLTDFFHLKPIISEAEYPFICRCESKL